MKIWRTANAGVLLDIDGVRILIDGVCQKLYPYEATTADIRNELCVNLPDVLLYTHYHDDHYDKTYANIYKSKTLRSVYGPEFALCVDFGGVKIKGVPTRHIGKSDFEHASYIIEGTKCVWFMGDASPLDAKKISGEKSPDVIIVPYAYVTTKTAWEFTKSLNCEKIILVHMPPIKDDSYGLWEQMEDTTGKDDSICIPKMGETIIL